jgi:site-specific recombinase XerD
MCEVTHVDFERNTIKVEEGKGGYTRFVPLQEKAREELFKMLDKRRVNIFSMILK